MKVRSSVNVYFFKLLSHLKFSFFLYDLAIFGGLFYVWKLVLGTDDNILKAISDRRNILPPQYRDIEVKVIESKPSLPRDHEGQI